MIYEKEGKETMLRYFVFLITILLSLFQSAVVSEADSNKSKIILKMATNAPIGIGIELYVRNQITPGIISASEGVVTPDWYHGGIMGGNEDWVAKMQIDQLQGSVLDGSGVHYACPESVVMQLPFLFNGFDEVGFVKDMIRTRLGKIFQKNGYKMLFLADQSFDDIYSTKYAVRTPADFTKTRFLSYGGAVEYETLKILGASPIPVKAPEIPPSFRSRICDAMFAPGLWWVGAQLYTITKYITSSNLRYVMGSFVITMDAWNSIPEKYQKPLEEKIIGLEDGFNRELTKNNAKCLRAMIKYGIKEIKLTPGEIELLKKNTLPLWNELAGKEYPRELLDEMLGYLEEYRLNKA